MIGGKKRDSHVLRPCGFLLFESSNAGADLSTYCRILAKRIVQQPGNGDLVLFRAEKISHMRVMSAFSKVIDTRCCNTNTGEEVVCMEISHYQ